MPRPLSVAMAAAVVGTTIIKVEFARFEFASGPSFLWTGIGSRTFGALGDFPAATWQGGGTFMGASAIEETAELRATGRIYTLSGADASVLSLAIGEHVQGRPVTSWLGLFDAAGQLLDEPAQIFAGLLNTPETVDEGDKRVVRITAENRLFDFERPADPQFYTGEDQKRLFPGDRGFDFVASLQDKTINWGRREITPAKKPEKPSGGRPGEGGVRPGGGGHN